MNEKTLVAVCCYAGDVHQVIHALPQYLHHQCPVVVFSPTDSPADMRYPGVVSRNVGKVGYIGQVSIDRQRDQLAALLDYGHEYFLLHDSDSLCLNPEIPDYLYSEPDVFWSNEVKDDVGSPRPRPRDSFLPDLAFQPPYFFSRASIVKMLKESPVMDPSRPYIDRYMVQIACAAGLTHKCFKDSRSFPAWEHFNTEGLRVDGASMMCDVVREGVVIVHSVKEKKVIDRLCMARAEYILKTKG